MQIFRVILYKNPLPQGAIFLSRKNMEIKQLTFFFAQSLAFLRFSP